MSLRGSPSGRWGHCKGAVGPPKSPILSRVADLDELTVRMRAFTEARDWGRLHDLKSLTFTLTDEIGERAELVQWLPTDDDVDEELRGRLG
jgi:hypothetical protein